MLIIKNVLSFLFVVFSDEDISPLLARWGMQLHAAPKQVSLLRSLACVHIYII